MNKKAGLIQLILYTFILFYLFLPLILADEDTTTGFGSIRLENEYKLDVPDKIADDVYNYLLEGYKDPTWLSPELSTTTLEEKFVDTYFDTPNLEAYDRWAGIRYRQRYDNGELVKQLIQIKVTTNKTDLTREEMKFPVNTNVKSKKDLRKDPLIDYPLFGLVEKNYREDVYNTTASMNINPAKLRPIINIIQTRKRVYLNNPEGVLITITLDETSGKIGLSKTKYHELELELNEIQYTSTDSQGREKLNSMSKQIYQDIIKKFPEIKVDQEPKYEKTLDKIQTEFPLTKFFIKYGFI